MIPYLLLYHCAKFEGQEAMGSRQARELNLLTIFKILNVGGVTIYNRIGKGSYTDLREDYGVMKINL